jgi:predicted DCC family thiol-disulfide oxidoreductase YuxK
VGQGATVYNKSFSFRSKLEELFGFDLRSLAALRVAVALLIIGDLISRSRDLVAHYTDFGAVPRAVISLYDRWRISVHLMNGTWEIQALLFAVTGALAIMLLLGYRTRLMTASLWFLLASLDSRNPFIADGGDTLLRLTLFWAFFLPWGACFSIDRALTASASLPSNRVFSAATFAYAMQIVMIYGFSIMHKTSPEWRTEGTAVYYALNMLQMANPIGVYLETFPFLTWVITHGVFWFQAIGPVLLFFPFRNGPIRTAAVFGFILMHIGMSLCIQIGLFSWIAALAMVVFLPSWFWDQVFSRWRTPARSNTQIFYDSGCNSCSRWARIFETFALLPETKLSAVETAGSIDPQTKCQGSWVLIDENRNKYEHRQAVEVILERSPLRRFLTPLFRTSLGEFLYNRVAPHRRSAASKDVSAERRRSWDMRSPWEVNVLILALLAYVFAWNFSTGPLTKFEMSEQWKAVGYLLRLDQIWNPFSPSPPKVSEWYVITGKLRDTKVVDLLRNGENPSLEPTREHFANYRWRKYFEIVGKPNNLERLRDYARYKCRAWNRQHKGPEQIIELEVLWLMRLTPANPKEGYAKPEVMKLLEHRCEEPASSAS